MVACLKTHVLILGAGFGGLELASRLSDSLADEVRVTLIDQNESFTFGFSKLDILFGKTDAAAARLFYRDIAKLGVEFRQETVTGIDPQRRRVTTHHGAYDWQLIADHAKLIIDTRDALRNVKGRRDHIVPA